jgi:hypothetical protein
LPRPPAKAGWEGIVANRVWGLICLALLLSAPAWASMSMEEFEQQRKALIEREMQKEEARREKMAQVAEALKNKDFEQAVKLTSQIITSQQLGDTAKAEVLVMRGLAYYHKNELAKAKQDLDEAVRRNRQEARAYVIRSAVHEKENRREQAIADMEAYTRLKPDDQEGRARLQKLQAQASPPAPPPSPGPAQGSPSAPTPALGPAQTGAAAASKPAAIPALKLYEAPDKSYALHKPTNWQVKDEALPASLRITVLAPDQGAAVDFLWERNQGGQANALLALEAFRRRLAPSGAEVTWSNVYRSEDNSRATATVRYRTAKLALQGTFYFEASAKSLSAQGYMARDGQLAQQRPTLYNIMTSLAFSKRPASPPPTAASFNPQYVSPALVSRRAPDGSLAMNTPNDWGFAAAKGTAIASAANGGQGFAFLTLSGNPILRGATVAQGVIAQPYLTPPQALRVILAGFGHRDIAIKQNQSDPAASQEFGKRVGRRGDAQDIVVTWTSAKGAPCLGFFKMICASPSPTGLWFCILAGAWGPQQDFYRYYPLLEQVASSFSINDQYARRYIQDGLKRARELHDQTVAKIREAGRGREQQQADWEARQKRKEFAESKWDDYRRGNSYWVSDMENGKVYQTDSHGTRDTSTNDYYQGRGHNYTNFEGRNPRHPSETMREVSSYELQQMRGH